MTGNKRNVYGARKFDPITQKSSVHGARKHEAITLARVKVYVSTSGMI